MHRYELGQDMGQEGLETFLLAMQQVPTGLHGCSVTSYTPTTL